MTQNAFDKSTKIQAEGVRRKRERERERVFSDDFRKNVISRYFYKNVLSQQKSFSCNLFPGDLEGFCFSRGYKLEVSERPRRRLTQIIVAYWYRRVYAEGTSPRWPLLSAAERTLRLSWQKRERSTNSNRATRYSRSKAKWSTDRNSGWYIAIRCAPYRLKCKSVFSETFYGDTFPVANLERIINVRDFSWFCCTRQFTSEFHTKSCCNKFWRVFKLNL